MAVFGLLKHGISSNLFPLPVDDLDIKDSAKSISPVRVKIKKGRVILDRNKWLNKRANLQEAFFI